MNKLNEVASRPATLVLSTRLDARYLATTLLYWHQQGEYPRSMSELVRLNEEVFAQLLVLNQKAEFVQSQVTAREILNAAGLGTQKMNIANQRNLVKALQSEGMDLEGAAQGRDIASGHKQQVKQNPLAPDSPEVLEAQRLLDKRVEDGLLDRVAAANKQTEDFKQNLGIVPEGGRDED